LVCLRSRFVRCLIWFVSFTFDFVVVFTLFTTLRSLVYVVAFLRYVHVVGVYVRCTFVAVTVRSLLFPFTCVGFTFVGCSRWLFVDLSFTLFVVVVVICSFCC